MLYYSGIHTDCCFSEETNRDHTKCWEMERILSTMHFSTREYCFCMTYTVIFLQQKAHTNDYIPGTGCLKLGTIAPISNNRSSLTNPFHIADNLS